MQQGFLTHKTGSLSKILMGTAMIGFFGIFSPNTAAKAVDCDHLYHQHECESNDACYWSSWGPSCVGEQHCAGLDETTCSQTAGCFMSYPSSDMGTCYPKHW
ncbi:MAG: hypothetical protein K2W92_06330 [Alphaproteobacteria bacterium]|nr:hypothetical protein [Alphaproteobacteria bacterium]